MVAWSVALAAVGVLITRAAVGYVRRRPGGGAMRFWLLGLLALLPAWLVAFVALLGASPTGLPETGGAARAFVTSSAAALLGAILTDHAVRRLDASGGGDRPLTCWLLGVAALVPAWLLALLGLGWARP
ncbi:MAG TPA: hypothetical protein VGW35_00500 [Methylomirabilota bacterium]|jgi:hypothetical protein|nr:hypothetical protein [Methylomirabilota bacterium]